LLNNGELNIDPEHIDEEVDEEDEEIHENDNAYVVIFNTDKPVNSITQLGSLPDSLGWTNTAGVGPH
jgi:hypothetical protein